jgi:hypothetical protein
MRVSLAVGTAAAAAAAAAVAAARVAITQPTAALLAVHQHAEMQRQVLMQTAGLTWSQAGLLAGPLCSGWQQGSGGGLLACSVCCALQVSLQQHKQS